jgi:hypothetical protein
MNRLSAELFDMLLEALAMILFVTLIVLIGVTLASAAHALVEIVK